MVGHTGLAEKAGSFRTSSNYGFWASALKGCNAVSINGAERVLIRNVHASRMASECFYSQGPGRTGKQEPDQYTKAITYDHCSVTDCAANAFNNNDVAENTTVQFCRINGAGWHAYEGPAKFIRLIGNYVRNAGPFTIGDMSHRVEHLLELGCGQAVVTGNVFESVGEDRSEGIVVNHGATQVVIANNLFINYNGNAIDASSYTVPTSYPSHTITITGNIADMTCIADTPRTRTGISVSASNTIVADNQVYVRGEADPRVTGIFVNEPALNVRVHDNIVRNCNYGIRTGRAASSVSEIHEDGSFTAAAGGVPFEWPGSHLYRGWHVVWLSGGRPQGLSTIGEFDAQTLRFSLAEPHSMSVGDRFELLPPCPTNWDIHHNTVGGCLIPVALDSYGSPTAQFSDNVITRDGAAGVKDALAVRGRFNILRNHVVDFDEPDSVAFGLYPDRLGNPLPNIYQANTLRGCANVIAQGAEELWAAAVRDGNTFAGCGSVPR